LISIVSVLIIAAVAISVGIVTTRKTDTKVTNTTTAKITTTTGSFKIQ
jgi:hypothetical protein